MPAIRPEAVSNEIRLAYEFAAAMRSLIPKDSAVDSLLPAIVLESPPDEQGASSLGSQNNLLSGADELSPLSAIGVSVSAVMPFVQSEAVTISVLSQPPKRLHGLWKVPKVGALLTSHLPEWLQW